MAGAPALVDRYDNAPPASRALIEAAMDARRLGHGPRLPLSLLEAAAPGYMTDLQWDQAGVDWLERSLKYTTHPLYGASGPLTHIRARPGDEAPADPSYRLADYLEQHARTHRGLHVAPASFWDAAIRHTSRADDLLALGAAAHRRWRLRHAARLYLRADEAGHPDALWRLGSLSHEVGDREGAERQLRLAADAGHPNTLGHWAWVRDREGDLEAAEQLYLQAAAAGDPTALRGLAWMRTRAGDRERAQRLALQAIDAGEPAGLGVLAETHQDELWWKQLTRYGLEPDGSISRPWTVEELPRGG
ncbi:hypothetical protein ACFWBF_22710 [Streptomyces sp. NPDC060028]|uniref:hypothetical protein n=1 Tax=Streptomyces sp. NPDC060028 TaxID=3347041 RepID=UPI00369F2BFB